MTEMMAEPIKVGGHGAFITLDENADGYYVVVGELVCDARYYFKVAGAMGWYTPLFGEKSDTVVRVQQVVAADLKLKPIAADNKLPRAA